MCTCPCNWCHTLRKSITNIVKSNTLPINNARNKFAHGILMRAHFPMGLINIHWYKNDTNIWILFAYTKWMIFIFKSLYSLSYLGEWFLFLCLGSSKAFKCTFWEETFFRVFQWSPGTQLLNYSRYLLGKCSC